MSVAEMMKAKLEKAFSPEAIEVKDESHLHEGHAGARPGDVLILTKPIGTGIITFAAQIDRASASAVQTVADSMATLNKTAAELMVESGAHACTDVTGFGLLGHLPARCQSQRIDTRADGLRPAQGVAGENWREGFFRDLGGR